MRNYDHQSVLSKLNNNTGYAILFFTVTTVSVAGEHFFPTVKFLFQFLLSRATGTKENYPELLLRDEAILFLAKTVSAFLVTLAGVVFIGLLFTPIVGFTKTIKELENLKNRLTQTLRDHNKVKTDFNDLSESCKKHNREQLASIERFRREAEALNIEVSNTRHFVHDLAVTLNQLQAISAALGRELSQPEMTDKGGF